MKVIGLIQLSNPSAFEEYRSQVGETVALYQGKITSRGSVEAIYWNELECTPFSAYVELEFPDTALAQTWVSSPEYQSLLAIRHQAMKLTLFSVNPEP
ncbi:DUF1330 domain-containing protein [Polynucleobacter antarcticus]|uniref:DUF1330 domain-containing protein n=1 Tax=Polynucleobacter antarcticus TaxID=1743162 RepID=A0A6M9PR63_9BURK|nr:DUF1330 domain-containing protein [Polynucleobacter antarcticus]QKM62831.1 hypothetical protein DCO16_07045 [Polynucleobacter antarcticus]